MSEQTLDDDMLKISAHKKFQCVKIGGFKTTLILSGVHRRFFSREVHPEASNYKRALRVKVKQILLLSL